MKLSIITVCLNSEATIADCIKSVRSQNFLDYEHIIIDGKSTDKTLDLINTFKSENCVVISEEDSGIYHEINKGIALSNGELIGILNSDDYYPRPDVLEEVVEIYESTNSSIISGSIYFVDSENKKRRYINPKNFRTWMLYFGWMLPHTSTFIASDLYRNHGLYCNVLSTAADYDFFIRLLLKRSKSFHACNNHWVTMRLGGATTSGFKSYLMTTQQMYQAIKRNGYFTSYLLLFIRLPIKFFSQKIWRKE